MYKTKKTINNSSQPCAFFKNLKIDDDYLDPHVLLDETKRWVVVDQKNTI